MVQSSLVLQLDKLAEQCAQGQHRRRYYSLSPPVTRTKAVKCIPCVFRAQRIITELLVHWKGLIVNGYASG